MKRRVKRKTVTVNEYDTRVSVHTILLENVRYQPDFSNIVVEVIKQFVVGREIFFGFCRTDGTNLTFQQEEILKNDIPAFFEKEGNIQNLDEYLSIARIDSEDYCYSFIPNIFDYYLDTVMFNPKIKWEHFKQYHSNYQKQRIEDIISNQLADMLLFYFDSRHLMISFNSQVHNPIEIRKKIELILSKKE